MLLIIVMSLVTYGFIALHSAADPNRPWHLTQLGWLLFSTVLATLVCILDYKVLRRFSYIIFGFITFLLVLVPFIGAERNNTVRWLDLGIIDIQPSELAKIGIILVTARFLYDKPDVDGYRLRDLLLLICAVIVPVLLVATQPDLGTALVILAIFITLILFARIRRTSMIIMLLVISSLAIPVWNWGMRDYQRVRVTSFLNPEGLSHESGWQVRQSVIAIASGGVTGKGHRQGTQVQWGYVPENENDFIFAHIGEEYGFIGSSILLFLYSVLIFWSLRIARYSRDRFGVLVAVGVASLFFWHVVINIGMVLGLLPVVGLWLPFVSYGGSSMVTVMICVGLLMNLSIRRNAFQTVQ